MNFESLIGRLKQSPHVDGLMLIGSTGQPSLNPHSDRDLLVVLDKRPVKMTNGTMFCEGVLVDLVIKTREEIYELVSSDLSTISVSDPNASFFNWMSNGEIVLDRYGRLGRLRDRIVEIGSEPTSAEVGGISRADKALYNLAQTERMIESPDPVYQQAVDLRMLYQLADLMVDYFHLRGLLWTGEKDAIRYWQANDPDYLDLFTRCSSETDREHRVRLYGELVGTTINPTGFAWDDGEAMFVISPAIDMTRDRIREAQKFWRSLLQEP